MTEWLPGLLDLVVHVIQISAGLVLAYGAYLVILQISAPLVSSGTTSGVAAWTTKRGFGGNAVPG